MWLLWMAVRWSLELAEQVNKQFWPDFDVSYWTIFGMFASFLPGLTLNKPSNAVYRWLPFETTFFELTEFGINCVACYHPRSAEHLQLSLSKLLQPYSNARYQPIFTFAAFFVFFFHQCQEWRKYSFSFHIGRMEDRRVEMIFCIVAQRSFLSFLSFLWISICVLFWEDSNCMIC